MGGGVYQDPANEIEAVIAARVGEQRFRLEFGRKGPNGRLGYIGWIRQDQIIAATVERREEVRLLQRDAVAETVVRDIALGDL